jgi:hypothetical protein
MEREYSPRRRGLFLIRLSGRWRCAVLDQDLLHVIVRSTAESGFTLIIARIGIGARPEQKLYLLHMVPAKYEGRVAFLIARIYVCAGGQQEPHDFCAVPAFWRFAIVLA